MMKEWPTEKEMQTAAQTHIEPESITKYAIAQFNEDRQFLSSYAHGENWWDGDPNEAKLMSRDEALAKLYDLKSILDIQYELYEFRMEIRMAKIQVNTI